MQETQAQDAGVHLTGDSSWDTSHPSFHTIHRTNFSRCSTLLAVYELAPPNTLRCPSVRRRNARFIRQNSLNEMISARSEGAPPACCICAIPWVGFVPPTRWGNTLRITQIRPFTVWRPSKRPSSSFGVRDAVLAFLPACLLCPRREESR